MAENEEFVAALRSGFQLHEFKIEKILGQGGFGITYLAKDMNLNQLVAVKEYFPNELAVRDSSRTLFPKSKADENDFKWGMERFLKEARTLAQFKHPNIVRVTRFFEAHGTAYMVMDFVEGTSLSGLLKDRRAAIEENELKGYAVPLLEGLMEVHEAGFLHRDITPGNIFISKEGKPVLIDFGSARHAVGGKSRTLANVVTPGYAPLEQYWTGSNEGPWTDIYSFGACLYRSISGKHPPEAPARQKKDPLVPAVEIGRGRYSEEFLKAIDWALRVDEEDRPAKIEDWLPALRGSSVAATVPPSMVATPTKPLAEDLPPASSNQEIASHAVAEGKPRNRLAMMVAVLLALAVPISGGAWWFLQTQETKKQAEMEVLKAKAEAERVKTEAAAREEAARLKAETERLKAEAAAREEAVRLKAEAERLKDEIEAKERTEREAKAKAEAETARLKAEAEVARLKAEAEARERAESEARMKAEAARLKAEAEARDKAAKAEADKRAKVEAARLKAEAEAREKAKADASKVVLAKPPTSAPAARSEEARDPRCDVSASDLSGKNLDGCDLSGVNLKGKNLSGTSLGTATLRGANLDGANLETARLGGANLSGASLVGAKFKGADLLEANFSNANLSGADFRDAKMKRANFTGADVANVNWREAYVMKAVIKQVRNLDCSNFMMAYQASRAEMDKGCN